MAPGKTEKSEKPTTLEALRALVALQSEQLTPRMRDAAHYALEHPKDVALCPLADLAQQSQLSPVAFIRMAQALGESDQTIAMASGLETDPDGQTQLRTQPVFCLLPVSLLESLVRFTHEGGRKIDQWTGQHPTVQVPFNQAHDDPRAFANANTLAELQRLAS